MIFLEYTVKNLFILGLSFAPSDFAHILGLTDIKFSVENIYIKQK